MSRIQGKTSSPQLAISQVYVGIDVSKSHLDAYVHPTGAARRVTNDKNGLALLVKFLAPYTPETVVLEATGRYHRLCHRHLHDVGFNIAVMNPYRTRKFSDVLGQLAKTDEIDAKILAQFGAMIQPAASTPPAPAIALLSELLTARRQAGAEKTGLQNQQGEATNSLVKQQIRARLKMCERHQAALEKEIRATIQQHEALKCRFDILTSIPGIALITAATLIAELDELGTANASQIAALVGVAPMNCDSGVWRGQRRIRGGRQNVRNALYMAALAASRASPDMARFYKRLKNNGKPFKVAITAVMRKLAILANTLITENRKWELNHA
jgi:transposase